MLFLRISLLLIIVQFSSAIAGSPDEFWQEYQTSAQSGKVRSVVEHVMSLSTKLEIDTPQRLEHKKSAILWFMATGGKNGFRKTLATPAEREVMVATLIFATILHEVGNPQSYLPIINIRRAAGIKTEDQVTKTHLTEVQKIITATHILRYGSFEDLREITQQHFNNEYISTALFSKNLKHFSIEQWQQEVKEFSSILTLSFDRVAKTTFSHLGYRIPNGYFGFKEPATETTAAEFRQLVLENCTPDPKLYSLRQPLVARQASTQSTTCRPMQVITDKGMISRSDRGVSWGSMSSGISLTINDVTMSKLQTEEEFLNEIRRFANIMRVIYS